MRSSRTAALAAFALGLALLAPWATAGLPLPTGALNLPIPDLVPPPHMPPVGPGVLPPLVELHYVLHGVHDTLLDIDVTPQPDGSVTSTWTFPQALTTVDAAFGPERALLGSAAYSFLWVNPEDVARGHAIFGYDDAQLVSSTPAGSLFVGQQGVYSFGPDGYLVEAQGLASGSILSLAGATILVAPAPTFSPSQPQSVTLSSPARDFDIDHVGPNWLDPRQAAQHIEEILSLTKTNDPRVVCGGTIDDPLGGVGGFITIGNPLGGAGSCTEPFQVATSPTAVYGNVSFPGLDTGHITGSLENANGQVYYSKTCTASVPATNTNIVGVADLRPACSEGPVAVPRGNGAHQLVVTASFDHCLNPATQFRCPFTVAFDYTDG